MDNFDFGEGGPRVIGNKKLKRIGRRWKIPSSGVVDWNIKHPKVCSVSEPVRSY